MYYIMFIMSKAVEKGQPAWTGTASKEEECFT